MTRPHHPRRSAPPPRRHPVRWFLRLTGGLSLAIITVSGIGHAVNGSIGRVDAFGGMKNRPGDSKGLNFLVVGTDGREGLDPEDKKRYHLGGAACHCTDTIMLVHLSVDRSRAAVVSIPRDSYAEIPRPAKINSAYSEGGPKLTIGTIEKMTGVHIDHYLEVDFISFMKTVDLVQGVQVCTVRPLKDPYSGLDLPAGTSTLNGGQALEYVRSRHLDGAADLGRMQRQQRFLAQLIHKIADAGLLSNPATLGRVASAVLGSVRADQDLRPSDLIALAQGMRGFTPGSSEFTSVPLGDTNYQVQGIGSTVKWDETKSARLWDMIRQDQPLIEHRPASDPAGPARPPATEVDVDPASVRVQVDNGTDTGGLGETADKALRSTGFSTTGKPGISVVRSAQHTVITYDPRWSHAVKSLVAALPGAVPVPQPGQGAVMRVTVGADYKGVSPVRTEAPLPTAGKGAGALTGDQVRCPDASA